MSIFIDYRYQLVPSSTNSKNKIDDAPKNKVLMVSGIHRWWHTTMVSATRII